MADNDMGEGVTDDMFSDSGSEEAPEEQQKKSKKKTESPEQKSLRDSLEQFQHLAVTHKSYKQVMSLIVNKAEIIESQVGNVLSRRNKLHDSCRNFLRSRAVQNMIKESQEKIAPYQSLQQMMQLYEYTDYIVSWLNLELEYYKAALTKLNAACADASALDIEAEVTKGIREMHDKMMNFTKDMVTTKVDTVVQDLSKMNEKMDGKFERMQQDVAKRFKIFEDTTLKLALKTIIEAEDKFCHSLDETASELRRKNVAEILDDAAAKQQQKKSAVTPPAQSKGRMQDRVADLVAKFDADLKEDKAELDASEKNADKHDDLFDRSDDDLFEKGEEPTEKEIDAFAEDASPVPEDTEAEVPPEDESEEAPEEIGGEAPEELPRQMPKKLINRPVPEMPRPQAPAAVKKAAEFVCEFCKRKDFWSEQSVNLHKKTCPENPKNKNVATK
jgi:hypothetical protein